MFKSFFLSKEYRIYAWLVLLFLIGISIGQVYMSVLFNDWYKVFYDSLQAKDYTIFVHQIWMFSGLAAIAILLSTLSTYVAKRYTFKWRQAMNFFYLEKWVKVESHVEGASQRIQEDTMNFAKLTYGLGLGALKAVMTLIAFTPILWGISEKILISGVYFPGFLVWVALVTSVGGMGMSWWVGRKLPMLEYNNQKTEAAFRKTLVYGEDNRTSMDQTVLENQFSALKNNYITLFNNFAYFSLWENFYSQAGVVLPYLVAAPSFFGGLITLGILVQIGNAFGKVHDSFSFFLYNWTTVNELRSVVMRLREFERSLDE